MCGGWRVKGILEGLCQAMNPKMKISIAPALTASVNNGLRPPATESNTILTGTRDCLRKPRERREGRLTKSVLSIRGTASQQESGASAFLKHGLGRGRQPSAQHAPSWQRPYDPTGARLRLAVALPVAAQGTAVLNSIKRSGGFAVI